MSELWVVANAERRRRMATSRAIITFWQRQTTFKGSIRNTRAGRGRREGMVTHSSAASSSSAAAFLPRRTRSGARARDANGDAAAMLAALR